MATFAIAVTAGFLVNAAYCVYLLGKNKTWGKGLPEDRGRNFLFAFGMGFLWFMGFYLFGVGKSQLGELGGEVGWPIFMSLQVLVANVWGLVTGEWKNADRRAFRYLSAGLAIIIAAVVVIARAS
jgi:L-rhamnose-H+ transport protein